MFCRMILPVAFVTLAGSNNSAPAQSNALTFTGVSSGYVDAVPRVIGWEFTTGPQPILVAKLGVYDHEQNGLQSAHAVGIYRYDTQTLAVAGTVPAGTSAPLSSFFRFTSVTPTVLDADTRYVVAAAWQQNADEFVWSPSIGSATADILNLSFDSRIALGLSGTGLTPMARFEDTTSVLEYPDLRIGEVFSGDPRAVFVGPNFTVAVAPVPEPMSELFISGMAIVGLSLLVSARRERLRCSFGC